MNFDTIVKQLQFTAGIEKALLKEFAYHQREIELRSLTAYKGENFDFESETSYATGCSDLLTV